MIFHHYFPFGEQFCSGCGISYYAMSTSERLSGACYRSRTRPHRERPQHTPPTYDDQPPQGRYVPAIGERVVITEMRPGENKWADHFIGASGKVTSVAANGDVILLHDKDVPGYPSLDVRARRVTPYPTPEPEPDTLDSVTREHSDRLHAAYLNRTFGDNSELGTFVAYLLDLRDKGLITIPSWDQ